MLAAVVLSVSRFAYSNDQSGYGGGGKIQWLMFMSIAESVTPSRPLTTVLGTIGFIPHGYTQGRHARHRPL
jgi:hypothetical protein